MRKKLIPSLKESALGLGKCAPGWANALQAVLRGWANGRPATLGQPPNADQPILESTRDIPHYFISSLSTTHSFSCRRHRPRGFSNATLNTCGCILPGAFHCHFEWRL